MTTAAATMATHHPRARLRVCAAWDMNPGAATVAVPNPSKPKAKPPVSQPPATPTRPRPSTHADLFSRSSEGQGAKKSTYMGFEKWWLPPPPEVKKPRSLYKAASLAYLGDCIYELYARRHFFFPPLSINEYNKRVMEVVRCESQDLLLNKLLGEDFLTQEESPGAVVKLLPCDHEVMGSNLGNIILQKCMKRLHTYDPKVVGPFPVPYASRSYVHPAVLIFIDTIELT